MQTIPLSERPRERLKRCGPQALSNEELLAVILGTGSKKTPVLALARELLSHFQSLDRLFDASLEELQEFPGIGMSKSKLLKAAFTLAERALGKKHELAPQIKTPQQAFKQSVDLIRNEKRECLIVLLLDAKSRLIQQEVVSIGILDATMAHPREVFYFAIKHKAHSLIVLHNHPSGDLTPSKADFIMTKQLFEASKWMCIPLLDHLIVSSKDFLSLKHVKPELFS